MGRAVITPSNVIQCRTRCHIVVALGAADAGWKIGWRDAIDPGEGARRAIEVHCYATLPVDFLQDERHQLYRTTDLAQ